MPVERREMCHSMSHDLAENPAVLTRFPRVNQRIQYCSGPPGACIHFQANELAYQPRIWCHPLWAFPKASTGRYIQKGPWMCKTWHVDLAADLHRETAVAQASPEEGGIERDRPGNTCAWV